MERMRPRRQPARPPEPDTQTLAGQDDLPTSRVIEIEEEGTSSFLLAEHQRVASLYQHNAAMGERRIGIHLLFVAGGGTLLLSLPEILQQPGATGRIFPIVESLLLPGLIIVLLMAIEGILTFQRIIERRIRATEYLRAINKINRFFADRDPNLLSYLPWPPHDDQPPFGKRTFGVADLRDVVAVLNSFFAGALGADAVLLFASPDPTQTYRRPAVIGALFVGFCIVLAVWWWHHWYENRVVCKAETEGQKRVCFPAPEDQ
jgi:hypothetical protein